MARARLVEVRLRNHAENTQPAIFGEEGFFGPQCPPKERPLPKASSRDLASPAPCAASRPFAPSDQARDKCASQVALLLRKRSPRPSLPPPTPKAVHASARPTLSSSRGARGRPCFAASGSSCDSFHRPISECRMLLGVFVALLHHLRVKPQHEVAITVLSPHFCRL
jgi:hypothetical protein